MALVFQVEMRDISGGIKAKQMLNLSVLADFVWKQSLKVSNFGSAIKIVALGSWMRMGVPLRRKEIRQRRGNPWGLGKVG